VDKVLLIETSYRVGRVGLALDAQVVGERVLDEARRHARDLVPSVQALLAEQNWKPRDLTAVFASRGPGSYTGLRVGIMAAKTLAYAVGCKLVGVETFAAIALQAPVEALTIDVWADAQQGKIYAQRFTRAGPGQPPQAAEPLTIAPAEDRMRTLQDGTHITGPGLEQHGARLPAGAKTAPRELWTPTLPSLLALGRERLTRSECDDPFALEPLYLRPSSAEEKWQSNPHPAPRPMP
jgi:tRNA threonylcarbamoyladenosine biosynthesis protein TsaB